MKTKTTFLFLMLSILSMTAFAQTFTMGKKCRDALSNARETLSSKAYQDALVLYQAFAEDCKTRDAKEQAAIGMAEAYNGLEMYEEAIIQADAALKISRDRSLEGYFQKAIALTQLGDPEAAQVQFSRVLELTEKNQDTLRRASNYALMAALYDRQMGQIDSALVYLEKAKNLDPGNLNYILQEGDMYLVREDYEMAYAKYGEAASMDPSSPEVYISKVNAALQQMDKKYGTTKAQELRGMMTETEKTTICADLNKAFELGWKDLNKELFKALICN